MNKYLKLLCVFSLFSISLVSFVGAVGGLSQENADFEHVCNDFGYFMVSRNYFDHPDIEYLSLCFACFFPLRKCHCNCCLKFSNLFRDCDQVFLTQID